MLRPSGFACKHSAWGTGGLSAYQLVCLKALAEWLTGRRLAGYLTNLANLRLFVEDPSLRADRRRSVLTREAFETAETP